MSWEDVWSLVKLNRLDRGRLLPKTSVISRKVLFVFWPLFILGFHFDHNESWVSRWKMKKRKDNRMYFLFYLLFFGFSQEAF